MPNCECPDKAVDHDANECPNPARYLVRLKKDKMGKTFHVCTECILSDYFVVKDLNDDATKN